MDARTSSRHHGADRIVVGVDGTDTALNAVRWAVGEARLRGLPLTVVHADPYAGGAGAAGSAHSRGVLGVAFTVARRTQPGVAVSTMSSAAGPADALLEAAATARLVVVGIIPQGLSEIAPPSVALNVAGRASCPVAVVHGGFRDRTGPVLVGIDDPDVDAVVLDAAGAEAALHGCGLVVLHAHAGLREHLAGHSAHDDEGAQRMAAALRTLADRYPDVPVDLRTPHGNPTTELLVAAEHAGMVVVGSHGRRATGRVLFGSTSRTLVRHSPVPVLVVSPQVGHPGTAADTGRAVPAEQT